jgi:hypothetical protein
MSSRLLRAKYYSFGLNVCICGVRSRCLLGALTATQNIAVQKFDMIGRIE